MEIITTSKFRSVLVVGVVFFFFFSLCGTAIFPELEVMVFFSVCVQFLGDFI